MWSVDANTPPSRFDGAVWKSVTGASATKARAIHATDTEVLLLGDGIYHRTATGWDEEPVTGATGVTWYAVDEYDGELFAVGYAAGTPPVPHVAHRVSGTWTELTPPGVVEPCGIAVAAADDIWIAGNDGAATPAGQVAHWNGTAWTTTALAGAKTPCAIAVSGGEVFVGGETGDIRHRLANGTWSSEPVLRLGKFSALSATGDEVWAAGANGAIVRN